jgi:hypothetical protein
MGTESDPRFIEQYLEHALSVIDHAKHIPKGLFKQAKGVMLLSAQEGGFLVSATSGSGVLISHNDDGSWGAPMAMHLNGFGGGAVFGYANQGTLGEFVDVSLSEPTSCTHTNVVLVLPTSIEIVIIMNHFAMNLLLQGRGETRLGLDAGFTCGKCKYLIESLRLS